MEKCGVIMIIKYAPVAKWQTRMLEGYILIEGGGSSPLRCKLKAKPV